MGLIALTTNTCSRRPLLYSEEVLSGSGELLKNAQILREQRGSARGNIVKAVTSAVRSEGLHELGPPLVDFKCPFVYDVYFKGVLYAPSQSLAGTPPGSCSPLPRRLCRSRVRALLRQRCQTNRLLPRRPAHSQLSQ